MDIEKVAIGDRKVAIDVREVTIGKRKVTIGDEKVAIDVAIDGLNARQATIKKAKILFAAIGVDGIFGRNEVKTLTSSSISAAGDLVRKLREADLIEAVSGFGKGKYKFKVPKT